MVCIHGQRNNLFWSTPNFQTSDLVIDVCEYRNERELNLSESELGSHHPRVVEIKNFYLYCDNLSAFKFL